MASQLPIKSFTFIKPQNNRIGDGGDCLGRDTISLKTITAINAIGISVFYVFSRIYFNQFLSESEIGFLFSLSGFLIFLQPFWAVITDFLGSTRRMYQLVVIGSGSVFLIYYLWSDVFLGNFWLLVFLFVAFGFFDTGRGPIWNSMVLTLLDETETDGTGFGDVRLFFSLGWAAGSVVFGWYLLEGSLNYIFLFSSFLFFTTVIFSLTLSETKRGTLKTVNVFEDSEARKLLFNREIWIFLLFLFISGVGTQAADNFLPIYLQDHFAMSTLTLGGFYAAGSLGEVPFFHYGENIIDRMGIEGYIVTGFVVQSLIWILLGFVSAPSLAFVAWIVRGMGYSFIVLGSVLYLDSNSPSESRTIGQSLFTLTFFGISAIVGRILGGFIAEAWGLSSLYFFAGALGFVGIAGLTLNWLIE